MHAYAFSAGEPPLLDCDSSLRQRLELDRSAPRYASYPAVERFTDAFGHDAYLEVVAVLRARGNRRPLALSLHLPFCEQLCCCACNEIVTHDRRKAAVYLDYLKKEIAMQGRLFAGASQVEQLHLGGGTPACFSDAQIEELMAHVRQHFRLAPDGAGEYAIEADARTLTAQRVQALRERGFNRLGLGVQDFHPAVQQAVKRPQPEAYLLDILAAARRAGFRSISLNLICGLPRQTPATMQETLSKVIAAGPDRISIDTQAPLPQVFKDRHPIDEAGLPAENVKLAMLAACIQRLTKAGYVYLGMGHFAKPTDALAVAQRQGRLHRNIHGYSAHAGMELVACGISGISAIGSSYAQNARTLEQYCARIGQNELPIVRGIQLSLDDLLRRIIIQRLLCNFELSIASVETAYPISFAAYFRPELDRLRQLEQDGLVNVEDAWITVTPEGRLLIRRICMVFDRYLNPSPGTAASRAGQRRRCSPTI